MGNHLRACKAPTWSGKHATVNRAVVDLGPRPVRVGLIYFTLRAPTALVERIDALAEHMRRTTGALVGRQETFARVLERGIDRAARTPNVSAEKPARDPINRTHVQIRVSPHQAGCIEELAARLRRAAGLSLGRASAIVWLLEAGLDELETDAKRPRAAKAVAKLGAKAKPAQAKRR